MKSPEKSETPNLVNVKKQKFDEPPTKKQNYIIGQPDLQTRFKKVVRKFTID